MPIVKRKTPEERFASVAGSNWRDALSHPYIAALCHSGMSYDRYDNSTPNIARALNMVSGWQGAVWQDKVFILILANLLWRSSGAELLTDASYNRLYKHLIEHDKDVAANCHLAYRQVLIWDMPRLNVFRKGYLRFPPKPKVSGGVKPKPKPKPKPKVLKRPIRKLVRK